MSDSRSIGSLIVKLVAQGVAAYKADVDGAAGATDKAAHSADKLQDVLKQQASAASLASAATRVLASAATFAASAFAAIKVVDLVRDSAMAAARFETMGVVMKVAGNNAGYSAQRMQELSQQLQASGISMMQSRNALTQLATANIDLAQASKLARAAQDLAVVGNVNSSEALGRLIAGIKSGEVEVLKSLGLNVSFEASYKKLAAQLGTTSDKLTEQQKLLARTDASLESAARYTGIYEESMSTASKQMKSMERYTEDLQVMLGSTFNEALTVGVMALANSLKAGNKEVTELAKNNSLKEWGNDIADMFAFAADAALSAISVFQIAGKQLGYIAARTALFMSSNPQTKAQLDAYNAAKNAMDQSFDADMERLRGQTSAMRDALAQRRKLLADDAAAAKDRLPTRSERDAKDALAAQADAEARRQAGAAAAAKAANKEFAAQAAILAKLSGYNADYEAQAQRLSKMKMPEEVRAEALRDLVAMQPGVKALADAEQKEAQAAAKRWAQGYVDQIKEEEKAYRKLADAIDDVDKAINAMLRENDAMQASNELELSLMGKTAEERQKAIDQQQVLNKYLQEEINARNTLSGDVLQSKLAMINTEKLRALDLSAQKQSIADWNRTYDRIESGLVDALMKGGHEGAQAVRELLVDALVSEPFEIVVRALLQPVTSAITNMAMGAVGEATGMGSLLNGASSASSLYNMGSKAYAWLTGATELGGSAAAFTSSLGAATAASTELATGLGTGNFMISEGAAALTETFVATAAPVEALAGAAVAAEGGLFAGAQAALAAIPVWGWAVAGLALFGGDLFGGGGGPKVESGYGFGIGGAGHVDSLSGGETGTSAIYAKGLEDSWGAIASKFNLTSKLSAGAFTSTDPEGDALTQVQVAAGLDGQSIYSRADRLGGTANIGNVGRTEEELVAALQEESVRVLFAALKASNLDAEYTSYLAGVGDSVEEMTAALDTVVIIKDFQTALESLPFENLKDISFDAAKGLIEAAGGLETLGANLSGYYDGFYSDSEKATQLTINATAAFAKLNLTMPAATEGLDAWYRATVEAAMAMDQSIPAVAQTTAGLLALSGSVTSLGSAAESVQKLIDGIHTSVEDSLWQMQYGMGTDAEKYGMWDVKAKGLDEQLYAATSIEEIARIAAEEIKAINSSWSLLDPTQQRNTYGQYEQRLETIDAYVTTSGADPASIKKADNAEFAKVVADAVAAAVAKEMATSAAAQQAAADAQAAAAANPVPVDLKITVNAPQNYEVDISSNGQ